MADKKVRRTAAERAEALKAQLAELEAKQIERAVKERDAKQERLAKVVKLREKYAAEELDLTAEISMLNMEIKGASVDDVVEEAATVSTFS